MSSQGQGREEFDEVSETQIEKSFAGVDKVVGGEAVNVKGTPSVAIVLLLGAKGSPLTLLVIVVGQ